MGTVIDSYFPQSTEAGSDFGNRESINGSEVGMCYHLTQFIFV